MPASQDAPARCPVGAEDSLRTERILATVTLLSRDAKAPGFANVCYAPSDVGLTDDGFAIVAARGSDARIAARLVHLAVHVRDRPVFHLADDASIDCDAWLAGVLRAEARAYAAEMDALEAEGEPSPYPFTEAYRNAPQSDRVDVIRRYLALHPDDPGVDASASAYAERCKQSAPRAKP